MDEDATFAEMMEGLDLEDPGTADYSQLSNLALMQEAHRVKGLLSEAGALVHPKTPEEIDLQGYYFGLTHEMRKRGML